MPINGKIGQKLVLTKPLGTQIAVNIYQWWDLHNNFDLEKSPNKFYQKMLDNFNEIFGENVQISDLPKICENMYKDACISMATLNNHAAAAMTKFNATSATDITGFGI